MPSTQDTARKRQDAERLADIFTIIQRNFMLTLSKELQRGKVSFPQYFLLVMLTLSKELQRGKVSFPQYFLLGFLALKGELTMTEIAKKMGHTTAAATGLVDRLEKLGHVKRGHAKNDRRKILVKITPSGEKIVGEVRDDMVGNILCIMNELDVDEQRFWVKIYEKVITYCQCP